MGNAAAASRRAGEGGRIGGVPLNLLKPKSGAIAPLLDSNRLGSDEIRAIDEMLVAEATVVGRALPGSIEVAKFDRIRTNDQRQDATLEARTNYLTFHEFWSIRAFFGDPTLRIVEKAVLEERPFSEIERDLGLSRNDGAARIAFIRGLRSYAALAEWVDAKLAISWLNEAKQTFHLRRLDGESPC